MSRWFPDYSRNPEWNERIDARYIRGSEAHIGENFNPVAIGTGVSKMVERSAAAVRIGDNTESPIEQELGAAIILCFERERQPLRLAIEVDRESPKDELLLIPQFSWSYYRSDWAILNPIREGAFLIECDGKEFHSSDDQRAHDKRKDAAAWDRGYLTMRFSGASIFKDADGCARRIYEAVCGDL